MRTQTWQKSSYCQEGEACLHIAASVTETILLTERGDPAQVVLATGPATFSTFLRALKDADG
jgi:hypothetical protein